MWSKASRHLCRGDTGKEEGLVDAGAEGHTQTISGTEKKKGFEWLGYIRTCHGLKEINLAGSWDED